ncbi:MAG: integration host factor subunit beta [Bacteroidales bacterium]|nr:integration host factor subunit beta [Bacteroidales bacterium]
MTKSELSAAIAVKTGQTVETAQQCVDALMDVVKETMAKGENIYLRGFGTFAIRTRAEKTAQNLAKGTAIVIPEHKVPAFKPSKEFKNLLK